MPTVSLDLESPQDLQLLKAQWRFGPGWAPGAPNEGLYSRAEGSVARLKEYDDSGWEVITDIRTGRSSGFTFGWYRIKVTLPSRVGNVNVAGARVWFETNIDDYGEVWIDGKWDSKSGAIQGFNVPNRVLVTDNAQPGATHVIACLAINGPLAKPGGGIFLRYGRLDFEK